MKMRDLIRYVEPTTTAPAWPPPWIGSFSLADPVLMPGRAILESFARVAVGTQLIIVIRFDTREDIGVMSRTVAEARDEVILDLTWLQAADREGLKLLRELKAQGTGFVGVSPYMGLLLAQK